jgi:hypothetical protein
MERRRGSQQTHLSIRDVDPSAADALLYVEDLLVRIRGEARALATRIVAGASSRRPGGGRGDSSGGPLMAVDRLDEIRAGLQRVVFQQEID